MLKCGLVSWLAKKLESEGVIAGGSLKYAKKKYHFDKYEPLKYVKALQNSIGQGCGKSLDDFLPRAQPPKPVQTNGLLENNVLVFLTDMEPAQHLGLPSPACHKAIHEVRNLMFPNCSAACVQRLHWINVLLYHTQLRVKFKADWVHRIHNDAKLPAAQVGLEGQWRGKHFEPQVSRQHAWLTTLQTCSKTEQPHDLSKICPDRNHCVHKACNERQQETIWDR